MPKREQSEEPASGRILTVSNALTFCRILTVPFLVVVLLAGKDRLAAVIITLAAATDFLDGWLARRQGPTLLGRILDPVADRVLVSSIAIVLAVRGLLPVWAVAILVGRDLLALAGSVLLGGRVRVNRVGKAATGVLMAAVALVAFDLERIGVVTFYAGLCLSVAAGLLYLLRIREILGGGEAR